MTLILEAYLLPWYARGRGCHRKTRFREALEDDIEIPEVESRKWVFSEREKSWGKDCRFSQRKKSR